LTGFVQWNFHRVTFNRFTHPTLDDAFWEQLYQQFCWLPDDAPAVFRRVPERVFEIVG